MYKCTTHALHWLAQKQSVLRALHFSVGQISQAQRKTDQAKDLEGIDLGNVVQGSRRRGRPDYISPPNKKRRRGDAHVGSSDNEDSQGSGSGGGEDSSSDNEDSEAEFELSG